MGFFNNIVSGTIKTALTPLAVVKDAVNVVSGKEANTTKDLLNSAKEDLMDAGDDLTDGNL